MIYDFDYNDNSSIIKLADRVMEVRRNTRYQYEKQWFLNMAWYAGAQNLIWSNETRQLTTVDTPAWRVRLIINLIMPAIRTIIAKIYRGRPKWDVLPATPDPMDIEIAELDQDILDSYWESLGLENKILDVLEWTLITGNCFLKVCWNPELGPKIQISPIDLLTEEPNRNNYGEAVQQYRNDFNLSKKDDLKQNLPIGDIDVKVLSPFEVWFDGKTLNDSVCVVQTTLNDLNETKARYKREDIAASSDVTTVSMNFLNKIAQTHTNNSGLSNADPKNNKTLIHEIWIKPNIKHKHGMHCIIAGGKIVKKTKFPYELKELPFIHFEDIKVQGRQLATSVVEQMMPIQSDYNKTRSQMVEARNLMGKPKWLAVKGHGIAETSIDSEPGEVIETNMPGSLTPIDPPNLPSYIQNMLQDARNDIEDITGQHEASRAEAPGQIRGQGGVLALIEQDEARLTTTIIRFEENIKKLGRIILQLAAQYVTEERLVRIVGDDNSFIVKKFKGSDLKGSNNLPGVNYFDVRLETISGMPNNRAAQVEMIGKLANLGFLNPQTDRRLAFHALKIGSIENIVNGNRIHRSKALEEQDNLKNNIPPQIEQYQDHQTHIETHQFFQNSAAYQGLSDELKQVMSDHVYAHKQALVYAQMEPQLIMQSLMMKLGLAPQGIQNGSPENGSKAGGNQGSQQRQTAGSESGQ